ncbi:CDP-diacylglycerol--glycerol-3-phosphate 3-phosphatidyltransferase [Candidatus Magnetominusculus xianensis]|uniref:CDP-diacylglycerol--glycerol-3-phosphate 3-phosphatidyltransferase n=1 Tax=Candidatus Magnetominusculus xianensis TaxID=1748249 RepID=A0ABR5SFD2_9BACT|nr:CDP-diacylglycerol--glycerol-3-phosphate 3-phosphatidyltransferase [Candidatus Magnetominusculus xianensis]KWT85926.1 CDP-diacylglycerol--glycerol-3-phosphate 3-phosphatidyltransferase [Candidatus Magnetominusculus xianensis]MBF0403599.1 CDP-diacylglycerol--glycerol-3-phosphate 3-phosphatidyltransferase [Nitrospirota bacterium]
MTTLRLNVPTILTLSRILVIPVFIYITPTHQVWGAVVFGLASITDFLDGYLARRSGQITQFGIIMDPIADKFLVISALILLVDIGNLSMWLAIIIIVREFLVTTLRVVALTKDIVIAAELGGKLKTGAQIAGILCLILENSLFGINLYGVGLAMIWIAVVLAVVSAVQYTVGFWKKI